MNIKKKKKLPLLIQVFLPQTDAQCKHEVYLHHKLQCKKIMMEVKLCKTAELVNTRDQNQQSKTAMKNKQ